MTVGASGAAQAQSVPDIRVLPLVRVLYDSNIARSSSEAAEARGVSREDVRFTTGLAIDVNKPIGYLRLYGSGEAGYDVHLRNSQLDRERIQLRGGAEYRSGRCIGLVETQIERRQTELEDIDFGPVDNLETVFSVLARVGCPREAGFYPVVSAGFRTTDQSQENRRSIESETKTLDASLVYARPTLGQLALTTAVRDIDFPNREVPIGGGQSAQDGFRVYDVGVRFERNLGSVMRGSLALTHTNVDARFPGDDFSGLSYELNLRFLPNGPFQPRLAAQRRVEGSNRVGVLYQLDETILAELGYDISPRTRLTLAGLWREREVETAPTGPQPPFVQEESFVASGSVGFAVTRTIGLTAFAQREIRETPVPIFNYKSVRVGLSTRLVF